LGNTGMLKAAHKDIRQLTEAVALAGFAGALA
jgi:ATP-dependent protease HslVU (ClpYQ) peptidase subunit